MKKQSEKTAVIFRKFPDGGILAIFPLIPATYDAWRCLSYMHQGQHGAAAPGVVNLTNPATAAEYSDLLAELRQIGYCNLEILKRFPADAYRVRQHALNSSKRDKQE